MAKRKASGAYLTEGEKIAGTVFFVIYLLVLPFVTRPALDLLGRLLGTTIGESLGNTIYYYVIFAVTLIIFHRFIGHTTTLFLENAGGSLKVLVVGLIAFYGLNELIYRLTRLVVGSHTNLNDMTISAQIDAAPRTTLLIVVILAPFVEEMLFRGLVFGGLRGKSRVAAYAVSCALFALLHVWQYALVNQDITYLALMIQYLVPGLVLAWCFDRSGTLWTSILLHAGVNALSYWAILT